MRRRWGLTVGLFAVLGAVAGVAVGLVAHFYGSPPVRTTFGWYSYDSRPRYTDYLPGGGPHTDWIGLLGTSVGIGAVAGIVLAALVLMTGRTVVVQRAQ